MPAADVPDADLEEPGEVRSARRSAWPATLAAGGTVVLGQRRGPAALMLVGALSLLAMEVLLLPWTVGSASLSWRAPGLLVVTLVTALVFVPFPGQRMLTGGPRLRVAPGGLRYGRFAAGWDETGPVRVTNGQNVEVGERRGRFPFDNAAVAFLMRRGLRARGSWLSAWLAADAHELAGWLEAERRDRT